MIIKYEGYEVAKGTRMVRLFYSDMHILTFWSEYSIESNLELEEQVKKFEVDRRYFEWVEYSEGKKYHEKQA